ncbi:MAG: ThiF family adenylyltransferase, partial [Rhodospirillales bacterium]|nr:ThiF family adenylyltransferase [Rhodospirillales bacterium]
MEFTDNQLHRYARHIVLPEVGGIGQAKLMEARVLVVGAGGLGAPLLMYLAAAGVGVIGVVDDDVVDLSNLQRQVIHGTSQIGNAKVQSAREAVADINPEIQLIAREER